MEYMRIAYEEAQKNETKEFKNGGPFGAVIIKNNKIIAKANNTVLKSKDPTAHAEINVIRKACKKLRTHDLSDCILYTNCEPCPMCYAAIIWANIKQVYYGNTRDDADAIGFRDEDIYDILKGEKESDVRMVNIGRELTIETFNNYKSNRNSKNIY